MTYDRRQATLVVAWTAAGLAFLFLWASLRGSGTGPMGLGIMHAMGWLAVPLIAIVAITIYAAASHRIQKPTVGEKPRP